MISAEPNNTLKFLMIKIKSFLCIRLFASRRNFVFEDNFGAVLLLKLFEKAKISANDEVVPENTGMWTTFVFRSEICERESA